MPRILVPGRIAQQQPLQLVRPDFGGELLSGGKLLALILGSQPNVNLADGRRTTRSGSIRQLALAGGIGPYNPAAAGDIGVAIEAAGGSVFVDFWYGRISSGGSVANKYLFGDYTGSAGYGITAKHADGLASNWGLFNGAGVENSGEAYTVLMDGNNHTIIVVRDVVGGTVKVYRDGILKITSAGVPTLQTNFASGSIGINQFTSFGTESIPLIFGRMRYRSWNQAAINSFNRNPFQVVRPRDMIVWDTAVGGGSTVLVGAATSQANSSTTAAVLQKHKPVGAATGQLTSSSTAPLTQHHTVAAAATTQANASSAGAIVQKHKPVGASTTQANASATGAIVQKHKPVGATATQVNNASTATLVQKHKLTGTGTSQANTTSVAALGSVRHTLTGTTGSCFNTSSTGSIVQKHKVTGTSTAQGHASGTGAATQHHTLVSGPTSQANGTSTAAAAQRHKVLASSTIQAHQATTGPVMQRHVLIAAASVQLNQCSTRPLGSGLPYIPSEARTYWVPARTRLLVVTATDRNCTVAPRDRMFVI